MPDWISPDRVARQSNGELCLRSEVVGSATGVVRKGGTLPAGPLRDEVTAFFENRAKAARTQERADVDAAAVEAQAQERKATNPTSAEEAGTAESSADEKRASEELAAELDEKDASEEREDKDASGTAEEPAPKRKVRTTK